MTLWKLHLFQMRYRVYCDWMCTLYRRKWDNIISITWTKQYRAIWHFVWPSKKLCFFSIAKTTVGKSWRKHESRVKSKEKQQKLCIKSIQWNFVSGEIDKFIRNRLMNCFSQIQTKITSFNWITLFCDESVQLYE